MVTHCGLPPIHFLFLPPHSTAKPEKRKFEEDKEPEQEGDHDYETMAPPVPVRVHDIIIRGNTRTKDAVIESEVEELLRGATTFQELRFAAAVAKKRLRALDIFESVNVRVDTGPPELPGTANVVIEISEPINSFAGKLRRFRETEARSYEGPGKLKSLFGYGDIWDALVFLPRFMPARISLLSQDWLKLSSYKERVLDLSLGLLSTGNHHLSCKLSCRSLPDPRQLSSHTVRRQLGHHLVSDLTYSFKIDQRDSPLRPTRGFAFHSTTHVGGQFLDSRNLPFIRQDVDLSHAIPLGFCGAALKLGVAAGVFFPFSFQGFRARDLPSTILRSPKRLALGALADLSFDLPLKVLGDAGIHGHVFANTGCLNILTGNAYRGFSLLYLKDSFRCDAGVGVIIPTRLFRMEVNYCNNLKPWGHDQRKTGIEFSFTSQ